MEEEERPKPVPGLGRDLSRLSVIELEAYIAALNAEILRVQAVIAEKDKVRSAAEAMFRRSGA